MQTLGLWPRETHPEGVFTGRIESIDFATDYMREAGEKTHLWINITSDTAYTESGSPHVLSVGFRFYHLQLRQLFNLLHGSEDYINFELTDTMERRVGYQIEHRPFSDGRVDDFVLAIWHPDKPNEPPPPPEKPRPFQIGRPTQHAAGYQTRETKLTENE